MEELNKVFAERLRSLRAEQDITQKELADKIGITAASLSSYETGMKTPSMSVVRNIAAVCGVSTDWLCGLSNRKTTGSADITYADIINMLLRIESSGVSMTLKSERIRNVIGDTTEVYGALFFRDINLARFISEWGNLKVLHDNNTIDDNLYALWTGQQIEKLNFPIVPDDDQRLDIQIEDEEYRNRY